MFLPLWFRLIFAFTILIISSNIPFLLVGMYWGLPAIVLTTLWVGNSLRWRDSAYFVMLKFWFMGSFVVSLVEIVRQFRVLEEKGVAAYFSQLKWCIGLALICILVSGILGGIFHALMHFVEFLGNKIELWFEKETKIYKKTWLHRKAVYLRKRISGVYWRVKNIRDSVIAKIHKIINK